MKELFRKKLAVGIFTAAVVLVPFTVVAQLPDNFFGQGLPAGLNDLPPGLLRSQLENLPAPAKARATRWLQNFEFPAADVAQLRVDRQGGIFYEDVAPEPADVIANVDEPASAPIALTEENVFTLHSRPGASNVVHVNAAGFVVTGTAWNSSAGIDPFYMNPYDIDGDPSTFNSAELEDIADIWKRVAEDYAAFDIDVTTETPAAYGPNVGHILVSDRTDANGYQIYPNAAGGVAYVNVWGGSSYTYYQPALVFPNHLGPYEASYIAEAASHELGHNLGLSHDGTSTEAYYYGHGSGYTDWAPIMGAGYNAHVTQWSKGEYADANNQQDDLAIISGKLTYHNDDHADINFESASALVRSGATTIAATNPASDPWNSNTSNKGVISDNSDVDLFYIDVNSGDIDLTITPEWIEEFYYHYRRGSNLDVKASLYDETGHLLDQDDQSDDTFANVVAVNVPAGRYFLAVEGVGVRTPADGYSDYASTGQYFINGTVPDDLVYTAPPMAPDNLAASVNMAGNGIDLSWTDPASTPDTNEAGYRVFRQIDSGSWVQIASLSRDSSSYSDNNLTNGDYSYYLEVYNGVGSKVSGVTSVITISAPVYAYATSEQTVSGVVSSGSYLDTQNDAGSEVLSELHLGGKPSKRVSALEHTWTITGIQPGALVKLEVDAEAPANSEGDDFIFSYVLNGNDPVVLGLLENGTGLQTLSANLPSDTSGTLLLRVVDTDRTAGLYIEDSLIVSRIEVSSAGDPEEQAPVISITELDGGYTYPQSSPFDLVATADDYEDGDLSSQINWISNISGHLHTGASFTANTEVSPLAIGTHTITASVTDTAGLSDETSITVTILDPNGPTEAYLGSLGGSYSSERNKWSVYITATVIDNNEAPVANATVTGDWSGAAKGGSSCVTDSSGQCTLSKAGLSTRNSSVTFSVTDIAHASLSYASDKNNIDSITVTLP